MFLALLITHYWLHFWRMITRSLFPFPFINIYFDLLACSLARVCSMTWTEINAEKRDSQMDTCNAAHIGYSFETHISISRNFAIRVIWLVVDLYSGVMCKDKLSRHQINWIKKEQLNCWSILCVTQFEISILAVFNILVALCESIWAI